MKEFTTLSLVNNLLGNIETIGETNYDNKAYENISNHEELLTELLYPIIDVARGNKTGRFSEDRQINKALSIIKTINTTLNEWITEIELPEE